MSGFQCPNCERTANPVAGECPHCGIVFAKARPPRTPASETARPAAGFRPDESDVAAGPGYERWGHAALLIALAWWTWGFATAGLQPALLQTVWHLPDLVFHEAGHVLFMPLGRLMTSLGGSLFQCALPLLLAAAFFREGHRIGMSVCVWWCGQNFVDVAPYIADARALRLVLLGGRTGAEVEGHDWEFILTSLGWLHFDRTLGLASYRVGLALMCGALGAGVWSLLAASRASAEADQPAWHATTN